MGFLSVIWCYQITCLWFGNKRFCNLKRGIICAGPCRLGGVLWGSLAPKAPFPKLGSCGKALKTSKLAALTWWVGKAKRVTKKRRESKCGVETLIVRNPPKVKRLGNYRIGILGLFPKPYAAVWGFLEPYLSLIHSFIHLSIYSTTTYLAPTMCQALGIEW